MRHVLTLTICGALAAPIGLAAQPVPDVPPSDAPAAVTPLDAAPDADAPPVEAVPPEQGPPLGEAATPPTTVQGVTVEAEDKDKKKGGKLKKKAAVTAGGVIGGLAGAAGGPVGKIAGSLVGKTIAKTVVGGGKKDKDKDTPATEVAEAAAPPATNAVAVTDTPSLGDPAPTPPSDTPLPSETTAPDDPPTG